MSNRARKLNKILDATIQDMAAAQERGELRAWMRRAKLSTAWAYKVICGDIRSPGIQQIIRALEAQEDEHH